MVFTYMGFAICAFHLGFDIKILKKAKSNQIWFKWTTLYWIKDSGYEQKNWIYNIKNIGINWSTCIHDSNCKFYVTLRDVFWLPFMKHILIGFIMIYCVNLRIHKLIFETKVFCKTVYYQSKQFREFPRLCILYILYF